MFVVARVDVQRRDPLGPEHLDVAQVVLDAEFYIETVGAHVAHRLLLEEPSGAVVVVAPHDQEVPAELVAGQPANSEFSRPGRAGGQEYDRQLTRQQAEQSGDLVDEGVIA